MLKSELTYPINSGENKQIPANFMKYDLVDLMTAAMAVNFGAVKTFVVKVIPTFYFCCLVLSGSSPSHQHSFDPNN